MQQSSLIDELEAAVAARDLGRRAAVLRRITDLFTSKSGDYSGDQVALFDSVMQRLLQEIDQSARAELGRRMAPIANAPPGLVRALALDDAIEVAEPVLTTSAVLDETTLVEGAQTKSQLHLLAISRRSSLGEAVTDVLVERGDDAVVVSTAANTGARFSEFGYSTLVTRSAENEALSITVWSRSDIPRQQLLRLVTQASQTLRQKFAAEDPARMKLIGDMIAHAAEDVQTRSREESEDYAEALGRVRSLHAQGTLSETELVAFAEAGRFLDVVVALSLLCDLPVGMVERALVHDHSEQLLVITRAIGLSWYATKAILLVRGPSTELSLHELERCCAKFNKLQPHTATAAMQFYRLRARAAGAEPASPGQRPRTGSAVSAV